MNMQGNITFCNDRYAKQFAWLTPSPVGLSSLQMVHPADQQRVERSNAVWRNSARVQVELRKPVQTGGYFWTLWEFIAVQDAEGTVKEIPMRRVRHLQTKRGGGVVTRSRGAPTCDLERHPRFDVSLWSRWRFFDYHTPSDRFAAVAAQRVFGAS